MAESFFHLFMDGKLSYLDTTEIFDTDKQKTLYQILQEIYSLLEFLRRAIASKAPGYVVPNIAARDAINSEEVLTSQLCWVEDASTDTTVESGAACYVAKVSDNRQSVTWIKVAEAESMDVLTQWFNIEGRPQAQVSAIDDAVDKKHVHSNLTHILEMFTIDANGKLLFNGRDLESDVLWDNIQNKPASIVSEIDDAVSRKHIHSNLPTILEKFTIDAGGNLLFNGHKLATNTSVTEIIQGKETGVKVNTIAERDALTVASDEIKNFSMCFVRDASTDPTVNSGAALYIATVIGDTITWEKAAELNDVYLKIDWEDVENRPVSTISEIDNAVQRSHTHNNLDTILNKLTLKDSDHIAFNGHKILDEGDIDSGTGIAISHTLSDATDYFSKLEIVLEPCDQEPSITNNIKCPTLSETINGLSHRVAFNPEDPLPVELTGFISTGESNIYQSSTFEIYTDANLTNRVLSKTVNTTSASFTPEELATLTRDRIYYLSGYHTGSNGTSPKAPPVDCIARNGLTAHGCTLVRDFYNIGSNLRYLKHDGSWGLITVLDASYRTDPMQWCNEVPTLANANPCRSSSVYINDGFVASTSIIPSSVTTESLRQRTCLVADSVIPSNLQSAKTLNKLWYNNSGSYNPINYYYTQYLSCYKSKYVILVPNILQLANIWLMSDEIDSLDPTLSYNNYAKALGIYTTQDQYNKQYITKRFNDSYYWSCNITLTERISTVTKLGSVSFSNSYTKYYTAPIVELI